MVAWAKDNAKTGMPDREDILFGPVNNANQFERVSSVIDALPSNAKV